MAREKCVWSRTCVLSLGIALTLGSLGMEGCDDGAGFALSLHPFYSQLDVQSDERLAGSWTDNNDDMTFTFKKGEGKEYKLVVVETKEAGKSYSEFEVHLLRLGPYWFLDFYPTTETEENIFWHMHVFRAHSAARIERSEDTMRMAFFDGGWLQKQIDEKTVDISHQTTDGMLVLTATTEEVQRLLYLHANDDNAFPDTVTLTKDEEAR